MTQTAQQEPVQSGRSAVELLEPVLGSQVAELVLDSGIFVTIYPIKVVHLVAVSNLSGIDNAVKLIQLCVRFDGRMPTMDDVLLLSGSEFIRINNELSRQMKV